MDSGAQRVLTPQKLIDTLFLQTHTLFWSLVSGAVVSFFDKCFKSVFQLNNYCLLYVLYKAVHLEAHDEEVKIQLLNVWKEDV